MAKKKKGKKRGFPVFYMIYWTLVALSGKKKMDIKIDYAELPTGPASGPSPEFLASAI